MYKETCAYRYRCYGLCYREYVHDTYNNATHVQRSRGSSVPILQYLSPSSQVLNSVSSDAQPNDDLFNLFQSAVCPRFDLACQ